MAKTSEAIQSILDSFKVDEAKAESGNASASTRARKRLMEIIKISKQGRVAIQEAKKAA